MGLMLLAGGACESVSAPVDVLGAHELLVRKSESVAGAAQLAAIHDDIMAMPMGYQSLVGDMGSSLSGGQRQRIILARALHRRPDLLALDEATSHLDVQRELHINHAVAQLNVTRILIAQRMETLASAQRVVVLLNGSLNDWAANFGGDMP